MNIRNLPYIRGLKSPDFPELGSKLHETLRDIINGLGNASEQTNSNTDGQPIAPPAPNGLQVTSQNGHFSAAITDNNEIYRGIQYYVEHDSDPNFGNPQIVHLGDSRNWNQFLGNSTRYFRAYSAYASSPPSSPVYHGSPVAPTAVYGGGSVAGAAFTDSQGSGTGAAGQGLTGPGVMAFRSASGRPPVRGTIDGAQGSTSGIVGAPPGVPTPSVVGGFVTGGGGGGGGTVGPTLVIDSSNTLAGKPTGLGAGDAGKLYYNSFFGRTWIWDGTVWHYFDGGCGAGAQVSTSSGTQPSGGLWQSCNGSTVTTAEDNCTLGSRTATNAAVSGGDAPFITGGGGGSPQTATAGATGNDSDAGVVVTAGAGSTVASNPHTHPTLAPSAANGGLPFRVSMQWWMRR